MKSTFLITCFGSILVGGLALAADPTAEELLKPTRLTLINAGNDLPDVLKEIEKQTGNKLIDEATRGRELPEWNFSLSDREFWPLLDKFLDATSLELHSQPSNGGLPVIPREHGRLPRFGRAIYVGPFRLEVTHVASELDFQMLGEHRASIALEITWEPRLRPLLFTQPVSDLKLIADETNPVAIMEGLTELTSEASAESYAINLNVPLQLPDEQLSTISSLKGKIKALVATKIAEFRFVDLDKSSNVEKIDGGVSVTLSGVRENQGLTELHMQVRFDDSLPERITLGSWNYQNETFLENAEGKRIEHSGFETTMQSPRELGLAFYFDVPAEELAKCKWVYRTPAAIVEVPIEFEFKGIKLP
jgi:hypothetical protein